MPVVTRGHRLAVAAPVMVLALAACNPGSSPDQGDDGPLGPEKHVLLASYQDLESESYRTETTMTVDGLYFLESVNLVEGERSQSSQDLYLGTLFGTFAGDFPEAPATPGAPEMAELMEQMEQLLADTHTETIVVDDVVYMQITGGIIDTSAELGEDAWLTADLTEGGDLGAVHEMVGSYDLASQTELLLNDITDVEETGDGVYTGTLDGDSGFMQSMTLPGSDPLAQETVLDAAEVVITLDDAGLLKSMETTFFPEEVDLDVQLTTEVVEIGGDYGISAPESDNLHSFEELSAAAWD